MTGTVISDSRCNRLTHNRDASWLGMRLRPPFETAVPTGTGPVTDHAYSAYPQSNFTFMLSLRFTVHRGGKASLPFSLPSATAFCTAFRSRLRIDATV